MSDIVPRHNGGDIIESVITKGDLSKLTPQERVAFYKATCDSVGLNPLTRPLEYIMLSGRLVLYARRDAADQLRKLNGISVEVVSQKVDGDLLTVHVRARDKSGRADEDFGTVSIAGLRGEARANAQMKAITKAKRRVTLSIAGLGFLDETEVDDIAPQEKTTPALVDTASDLDQFAAGETSEPAGDDVLRIIAEQTAMRGTEAFREWWKGLSAGQRDALRASLAEYQRVAVAADEPDDDPFGLPPPADTEQPSQDDPHPPAERVSPPAGNLPGSRDSSPAPLLDEDENLTVPLERRPTAAQLDYFGRQLLAMIAEQPLTAQRAARIRLANEAGIGWLKLKAVAAYDRVMRALNEKAKVDG